jgi:hypothetical protein
VDRPRITVHRLCNLLAQVRDEPREEVRARYWRALDEASGQSDGRRRLRELMGSFPITAFTRPRLNPRNSGGPVLDTAAK